MIDIVIPLGTGSKHNDLELRYTLRGIEKYLSNVRRVVIASEKLPPWINTYKTRWIWMQPETDHYRYLTRNIHEKIKAACELMQLSDDFLYMNDDHFLLSDFDAVQFPLHHSGTAWNTGKGQYKTTIKNTHELLKAEIGWLYYFDTHAPMLINKEKYLATVCNLDWKKPFGYCIKTTYQYLVRENITSFAYSRYPDLKIDYVPQLGCIDDLIKDRLYFSIGDKGLGDDMKRTLANIYPNKSKYEI